MRIAVLNYMDAVPTCVTGPADIWGGMLRMYPVLTGTTLKKQIDIDFISRTGETLYRTAFGKSGSTKLTKDVYDLVIIPAMRFEKIEHVLTREKLLVQWLKHQHAEGAELASICVGAFLLAETGLLKGKKATTNWLFADRFRKQYPDVELQVIVDQGHLYSCGGAFSFTSFMIYLIDKLCGHEEAVIASKILMINVHEQPQLTFSIFQFQHSHADDVIANIQSYIEKNYKQSLTLENLAGKCNMSVRNFMRRFEQATSNTPLEYLQRVRVEAAKKLLENKNESIEQVASRCGYEDIDFFRKIFKRHVAMTPRGYQEKYGKTKKRFA
ncbi:MAG: GlxA family transcriptional regulator [Bacteroidota bacterium]